jgi:hypothetical protein
MRAMQYGHRRNEDTKIKSHPHSNPLYGTSRQREAFAVPHVTQQRDRKE